MTPAEKMLWQVLRTNRFDGFHFRRQQIIHGFIADFYCHALALITEVDGSIHDDQVEYDKERDRLLCQHGFHILRLQNDIILHHLPTALEQLRSTCDHLQNHTA